MTLFGMSFLTYWMAVGENETPLQMFLCRLFIFHFLFSQSTTLLDLLGDTSPDATQVAQNQVPTNPVSMPQPAPPATNGGDLLDLLGDLNMNTTNAGE